MRWTEFQAQVGQLQEAYGKIKYPEIRVKILWDRFHLLSSRVFNHAVARLIASESFAPMLPKFEEILKEELKEVWENHRKEKISKISDCSRCNKTGQVYMHKKEAHPGTASFVFKCYCPAGELLFPNYPRVNRDNFTFTRPKDNVSDEKKIKPTEPVGMKGLGF